jgi:hypothetical protein
MNSTHTGLALLSTLLLTSPVELRAQVAELREAPASQGQLFIAADTFIAKNNLGFTRPVLVAVRLVKGGNANNNGYFMCEGRKYPDSITFEVLDPATKQVLGVAKRLTGNLTTGVNESFAYDSTDGCVKTPMTVDVADRQLTVRDQFVQVTTLSVGGDFSVEIPSELTLRR